mmetsp:Transcript_29511/g.73613  ORF Transcript_29511/g.73613 Transcript_29511/m.73613 type:complete len:279 (-) Transcript_29511:1479-2315(-)
MLSDDLNDAAARRQVQVLLDTKLAHPISIHAIHEEDLVKVNVVDQALSANLDPTLLPAGSLRAAGILPLSEKVRARLRQRRHDGARDVSERQSRRSLTHGVTSVRAHVHRAVQKLVRVRQRPLRAAVVRHVHGRHEARQDVAPQVPGACASDGIPERGNTANILQRVEEAVRRLPRLRLRLCLRHEARLEVLGRKQVGTGNVHLRVAPPWPARLTIPSLLHSVHLKDRRDAAVVREHCTILAELYAVVADMHRSGGVRRRGMPVQSSARRQALNLVVP